MKNKSRTLICLSAFISFSAYAEVSSTDAGHILSLIQPKKYTNYCGNDVEEGSRKYKEGNWQSAKDCLTDGRVHLVYANNAKGEHDKHQLERSDLNSIVQFGDEDKKNLLDAIYAGAQVYVGEGNHKVLCVESSIHPSTSNEAVCSTTDRIYADWTLTSSVSSAPFNDNRKIHPMGRADAEYNRYLTSGHREYHHIHLNDTLSKPPKKPVANASLQKKKSYAGSVYARSRIVYQSAARWYVRY